MADRYWVGGTGNWSDYTNHWAASSGGAPNETLPGSGDNVIFDAASHSTDYTMTVNVTAYCASMTWTNPASGTPSMAGGSELVISGNVTLVLGMGFTYDGFLRLIGTCTFTTNGVVIPARVSPQTITLTLGSDLTLSSSVNAVTPSLYLYNSALNCGGFGLTFTGNYTYINKHASTISNLSNLSILNVGTFKLRNTSADVITCSGTITMTGTSASSPLYILTGTAGSKVNYSAATYVIDKCVFVDTGFTGAGAPAVPTVTASDLGNNTGITFTYDRYWVGGTGNWSDGANHWALTSGGTMGQIAPNIYDDATFNTSSSVDNAAYTVTIVATANCLDFTMDGPDPADATKVTWAGSSDLNIYGSMNLSGGTAGITKTYTGNITFLKTSGIATITTNSVIILSSLIFNDADTTFQLIDNLTIAGAKNLTLTAGTFDATTNSKTVTLSSTAHTITGAFTFYILIRTGTASKTDTLTIASNITVSGTLTVNGNSAINRLLVKSNTLGTVSTITAAAISVTNADFQDITGAGAATWDMSAATGGSGNCGGNTMQALGDAAFTTAANQYFYKASGNDSWSTFGNWFLGTGGSGGAGRVPLPQDTAILNADSFGAASMVLTQDMPRIGSVNFTGATNTPTWTTSTTCSVYGSITLIAGMVLTASTPKYTFINYSGIKTINSAGKVWAKVFDTYAFNSSTIQLASDFENTGVGVVQWQHFVGTFDANDFNVTLNSDFVCSSTTVRTLDLGNGIWTFNGHNNGSSLWNIYDGTNLTLLCGTSTIKFTGNSTYAKGFRGGGKTYYNLWIATANTGITTVEGSNTFNDFKIDAGRTVKFTNSITTTVNTFTALGTDVAHIIISNTSLTTHTILAKAGGGAITGCDYIDIQEITGSPATTWYIGPNSTDVGSTCLYIYLSNAPITYTNTYNIDTLLQKLNIINNYKNDIILQKLNITNTDKIDALLKQLNITNTDKIDTILLKLGITSADKIDTVLLKLGITNGYEINTILSKLGIISTDKIDTVLLKLGITSADKIDTVLLKLGITNGYEINTILSKLGITTTNKINILLQKLNVTSTDKIDILLQKLNIINGYDIDAILKKLGISTINNIDILLKQLNINQEYIINTILKQLDINRDDSIDTILKQLNINENCTMDILLQKLNNISSYEIDSILYKSDIINNCFVDCCLLKMVTFKPFVVTGMCIPIKVNSYCDGIKVMSYED